MNPVTRLRELAREERQHLEARDYNALADLIAEKERLLHEITKIGVGRVDLEEITADLHRSHTLFAAAHAGARRAAARLVALAEVEDGHTGYTREGRQTRQKTKLERQV